MSATPSEDLKATVGKALGRVPSGVFVLTAFHQGRPWAMLASWVQQAGFDPPAVSVAVAKDRPVRETLLAARRFALAVVPQDDSTLMKKYARGVAPDKDPFEGLELTKTPAGIPVPSAALAYLDCELLDVCDFGGDHELFVARVTAGDTFRDGKPFMHSRGNGFHY